MTETQATICLCCGRFVARPTHIEEITAIGEEIRMGPGFVKLEDRYQHTFKLTRCERCRTTYWLAEAIAAEHEAVVRERGSLSIVVNLIEAVLCGLAVLGFDSDHMRMLTASDKDLRRALRLLTVAGSQTRWMNRLVPFISSSLDRRPSETPWGHVSEEHRQELRDAYARLLFERLGGTRKVAPPSDGARGCLLCGVGEIETKASDPEEAWGQLRPAQPGTLGGRRRVQPIWGYLCPVCAEITDSVGVLGPTAMERALVAFLGAKSRTIEPVRLEGVRAWVALPEGTPPNATPWAHEPDHEGIKRVVQSA